MSKQDGCGVVADAVEALAPFARAASCLADERDDAEASLLGVSAVELRRAQRACERLSEPVALESVEGMFGRWTEESREVARCVVESLGFRIA